MFVSPVSRLIGGYDSAIGCYWQAVDLFDDLGDWYEMAANNAAITQPA